MTEAEAEAEAEEIRRVMKADEGLECRGMEVFEDGRRIGVVVTGDAIVRWEEPPARGKFQPFGAFVVTDKFRSWMEEKKLSGRWWLADRFAHRIVIPDITDPLWVELQCRFSPTTRPTK